MIGVKMTEDEIVDLPQAGLLGRGEDPFCIPIAYLPAGVIQQGFSGGRDYQRRSAAQDPLSGFIGLQTHTGAVAFRAVRIGPA